MDTQHQICTPGKWQSTSSSASVRAENVSAMQIRKAAENKTDIFEAENTLYIVDISAPCEIPAIPMWLEIPDFRGS